MIIGLTGPNAAGKGEVAEYLKEKGFEYFSLSEIVREEASSRGLTHSREDLIQIGNELRKEQGPAVLAKRIFDRLNGKSTIVDSIRNPSEVAELKKNSNFILLGVDAPPEVRFKRELERNRQGCPKTFKEFVLLEEEENSLDIKSQQLRKTLALADVVIVNNSTLEILRRKIDQILNKRPAWDEYFMKMAYLAAERSTCLRHHVGAVIVKDKRILSTGYNGAPAGTKDCLELGCKRDELKIPSGERHEICRATHAEQNAIIQASLHGVGIGGATIYCTHSPCILCAKMIVNARIPRFVTSGKYIDEAFKPLFAEVGIEYVQIAKPATTISILE